MRRDHLSLECALPSRLRHRLQDLREDVPAEGSADFVVAGVLQHHLLAHQIDVFRSVAVALVDQPRVDELDRRELPHLRQQFHTFVSQQ